MLSEDKHPPAAPEVPSNSTLGPVCRPPQTVLAPIVPVYIDPCLANGFIRLTGPGSYVTSQQATHGRITGNNCKNLIIIQKIFQWMMAERLVKL